MILGTIKGSANIPKGAIEVTEEAALSHQRKVIENWPSISEVFFLRFGRYITTTSTVFCSAACINIFHPLLKFGRGTITAVIPSIALPSALIYYKTDTILSDGILALKMDCISCYSFKLLALQLYGGLGFPGMLGILNTATGHGVKHFKTDTRDYWKKSFNIAKNHSSTFYGCLLISAAISFLLPYLQHLEMSKIMTELNKNPTEEVSGEVL